MRHAVALLAILLIELFSNPQVSLAQRADEELAKRYFKVGEELYNRSDYKGALEQFTRAYRYSKKPGLLYNIARCQESLGLLGPAIKSFEGYMTIGPNNPERIKARIENLKARLAQKQADAAKQRRQLDAARRAAAAAAVRSKAESARRSSGMLGWTFAGSGIALLATGAVFGSLASKKARDLEAANRAGAEFSAHKSTYDAGRAFQTVQAVTLIAGGAAAIAGGVILFFHYRKGGAEQPMAWIAPAVDPRSASLSAGFSF